MSKPEVLKYFELKAHSYSQGIQRWPWKFLKTREHKAILQNCPDLHNKQVVDACTGSGFYATQLITAGAQRCLAVDISKNMLEQIYDPQIQKVQADFAKLNLVDPVDFILCAGGLEFAPSPEDFFKSASRNSSTGGVFMVLYPPQTFFAKLYQAFHFLNGISIQLFDSSAIDATAIKQGWHLIRRQRVHAFAEVALYEKREF